MKLDIVKKIWTQHKKFVIFVSAFLILDIILCAVLISGQKKSKVYLEKYDSTQMSKLVALDKFAHKGVVSNEYANFRFSQSQKKLIEELYKEKSSVAITVRLQILQNKKNSKVLASENNVPFMYGFLSSEDFNHKGKFISQEYPNNKRILVQGDLRNAPQIFDISFAIPKNEQIANVIPEGFFIYTGAKCKIVAACIVPAELGFDLTNSIPYYGFACNGGIVQFDNTSFDFSGATMVFPVQNSDYATMPEFSIILSNDENSKTTKERSVRVEVNAGGEKLYVNNVKQAREIIIPTAGLKAPFSRFELVSNSECISSLILRATHNEGAEVVKPIRTDPGLILNYKQSAWRTLDYEIFEWDRFPGIIFFDTRNYDIQDNFFRRLAYFVEKEGFKGSLLTNEELEGRHGYNAHDYSSVSLADFFNKAEDLQFELNKEELLLKKILIENKLLEKDSEKGGEYVKANDGGLVSVSRECPAWSRVNLLAHEGWHTLYFKDEEFRNYCSAVFYTFDDASREFLLGYFKSQPSLGYDLSDEYLLVNEFMAYIMQQRLSEVAKYFVHVANRGSVMKEIPELAAYIRKNNAIGFEDAAVALNDFVFDKYGIVCGNIALVGK